MTGVRFRRAAKGDVSAIIALLVDDELGSTREIADMAIYHAAFNAITAEGGNTVIVGELDEQVVATYQLTFIQGLSLRAARRAQLESVRVASHLRGQGVGQAMLKDAEARSLAAGCTLMQLTMNESRTATHRFYTAAGFTPSHIGFKRDLS